ncbi:uncharacterized protein A4U43_C08F24700 [Asparagus officinalis]|uniref:methyl-CpG-binding domain protein 4-like protein n=1 Tax=Asparagus officinalis TaxID=4686 RepID=UPI00098DEEAE|nr:methyl-CpG-binding domain protein 4-like protein [Asparagus officinalis]ONK60976.1 uncharacterized protein A4U43_C08F24700 [Asparagus officinalis]
MTTTTTTTRKSCIAKCESVKEKGGGGIRCTGGAKEEAAAATTTNNNSQSSPNPAPKPTTNQDLLAMLDSFRYTGGGGGITSTRAEGTSSKPSPNPNPCTPKTIKRKSPPSGVGVIVDGPDEEKGKKKRKSKEAKLKEEEEVVATNNRKRKKTEMNEKEEEEDKERKKRSRPRSAMTAKEKYMDCYKRVETGNTWEPPVSPYGLLQECHYTDPWRVLIICMLLNITSGVQVNRVLDEIFALCPNAEAATNVRQEDLASLIKPLGLSDLRSKRMMKLSRQYLENDWTHVTQLHGVGKYAADAYAIFCVGKPDQVVPEDHKLVDYWKFVCKMRN